MKSYVTPCKVIFTNTTKSMKKVITFPGTTQSVTLEPGTKFCLYAATLAEIIGFLAQAREGLVVSVVNFRAIEVKEVSELKSELTKGGEVFLAESISSEQPMKVEKDTIIDLGGQKLTLPTGAPGDRLLVVDGCSLTIGGKGTVDSEGYCIDITNDGNLVIDDGNFYTDSASIIQLSKGSCTINGGTFKMRDGDKKDEWGTKYLLNVLDKSEDSKIIVKGGTFYEFNPSTANPGEVIVPAGYVVKEISPDVFKVVRG